MSFFIGLLVGGTVGTMFMALFQAGSQADKDI